RVGRQYERHSVEHVGWQRKLPDIGEHAVAEDSAAHQSELAQVRFDRTIGALVDHCKVEPAALDVASQLTARRVSLERQLDLRMSREETVELGADVSVEQSLADQHAVADLLFHLLRALATVGGQRLGCSLKGLQIIEEGHTFRGERRSLPRTTRKQRDAELRFERFHLVAYRCLRDAERFGGAPEAACGTETGEDFQLAERERQVRHYRLFCRL